MKIQAITSFRRVRILGIGLAAATVLTGSVGAADPQGVPTTQGSGAARIVGQSPSHFVREAAQGNAAELALSELAQRKAEHSEVRQFAEHMVRDHREANEKLQSLGKAHGVSVSQQIDPKHQAILEKLQQLSGNEFDREYMRSMLQDHRLTIARFEQASRSDDAQVKQYANSLLPKLRQHMDHAKVAAKSAGLDDATIATLSRGSPDPRGGSDDSLESDSGKSKEFKHKQSENYSTP